MDLDILLSEHNTQWENPNYMNLVTKVIKPYLRIESINNGFISNAIYISRKIPSNFSFLQPGRHVAHIYDRKKVSNSIDDHWIWIENIADDSIFSQYFLLDDPNVTLQLLLSGYKEIDGYMITTRRILPKYFVYIYNGKKYFLLVKNVATLIPYPGKKYVIKNTVESLISMTPEGHFSDVDFFLDDPPKEYPSIPEILLQYLPKDISILVADYTEPYFSEEILRNSIFGNKEINIQRDELYLKEPKLSGKSNPTLIDLVLTSPEHLRELLLGNNIRIDNWHMNALMNPRLIGDLDEDKHNNYMWSIFYIITLNMNIGQIIAAILDYRGEPITLDYTNKDGERIQKRYLKEDYLRIVISQSLGKDHSGIHREDIPYYLLLDTNDENTFNSRLNLLEEYDIELDEDDYAIILNYYSSRFIDWGKLENFKDIRERYFDGDDITFSAIIELDEISRLSQDEIYTAFSQIIEGEEFDEDDGHELIEWMFEKKYKIPEKYLGKIKEEYPEYFEQSSSKRTKN